MCVVREKLGRASLRVSGSGVCISMKAMEGRRRTMWLEGYLRSSSRSRYLLFCQSYSLLPIFVFLSFDSGAGCGVVLFPECDGLQRKSVSLGRQGEGGENIHYQ